MNPLTFDPRERHRELTAERSLTTRRASASFPVVSSEAERAPGAASGEMDNATTGPSPHSVEEPSENGAPKRQSGLGRAAAWFWRGEELRRAKQPIAARRIEALRRAEVYAEIARRTTASPDPYPGRTELAVCELYRQSIRWSLRAFATPSHELANESASTLQPLDWRLIDESLLQKSSTDLELLTRVKHLVAQDSADAFIDLEAAECTRVAATLGALARALIVDLRTPERVVEALWLRRAFGLALAVALCAGIAGAVAYARDAAERGRDLAIGKPWHSSSLYSVPGCKSPAQSCDESPDYFVHTQEETNPWVEFDLGSVQSVSAVRVLNRKDCCTERTAPLVVEVSTDDHDWKNIARRDSTFSNWLANFPTTKARWVRLRVEKKTMLHLLGVRILR